jgi:hypothetical protein
MRNLGIAIVVGLAVTGLGALALRAQSGGQQEESEKAVKESEVPPAALATMKKVANGASFTEFAEEKEHGTTFYEGSFKGPAGKVDVLVTAAGDLVEIEEEVAGDSVPGSVRGAFEKVAGAGTKATFEKKTVLLYEAHFKKGEKGQELILTPDGRKYDEGGEKGKKEGDKDDDDDDHR